MRVLNRCYITLFVALPVLLLAFVGTAAAAPPLVFWETPDGSTFDNSSPQLDWRINTSIEEQVAYKVLIDDDQLFKSPIATEWYLTSVTHHRFDPLPDGTYYAQVLVRDEEDEIGKALPLRFTVDTIAPTGSITINDGDEYSTSQSVTLSLTFSDDAIRAALEEVLPDGRVVKIGSTGISETMAYTLSTSSGKAEIRVTYSDGAMNTSATYSDHIIIDKIPPTLDFSIAEKAVSGTQVTCQIAATDGGSGLDYIAFSETNEPDSWQRWGPVESLLSYPVDNQAPGRRTLYARVYDEAGNYTTASVTFTVDLTPPSVNFDLLDDVIYIKDPGVMPTSGQLLEALISARDAGSDLGSMFFAQSDEPDNPNVWVDWGPVEDVAVVPILDTAPGEKTVYIKVTDGAGNHTVESDTYELAVDNMPPTGYVMINAGAATTSSRAVTLTIEASDDASGLSRMFVSNDNIIWSDWQEFREEFPWVLSEGAGYKTVYVRLVDAVGNSVVVSNMIYFQPLSQSPDCTVIVNNGLGADDDGYFPIRAELTGIEAGEYRYRISDQGAWSQWGSFTGYSASFAGHVAQEFEGRAVVTVEVRSSDGIRQVQGEGSVVVDRTPPQGEAYLVQVGTTLGLACEARDNLSGVLVWTASTTDQLPSSWVDPTTVFEMGRVPIGAGQGAPKIFYAWVRDRAGNISDAIAINYPKGTEPEEMEDTDADGSDSSDSTTGDDTVRVQINGGARYVTTDRVILTLVGVKAADEIRVSNEGVFWTDWAPFQENLVHNIGISNGLKTVTVQLKDANGQVLQVEASVMKGPAYLSSLPASQRPNITDIDDYWAKEQIETLIGMGIINGYYDGSFRPENSISRAEFVKMTVTATGLTPIKNTLKPTFPDTADNWFLPFIEAAVANGIVKAADYPNGFRPSVPITRQEMAVMVVRAMGYADSAADGGSGLFLKFSDANQISRPLHVAIAEGRGIITGYPDGSFRPFNEATRAEAAVMVLRMISKR